MAIRLRTVRLRAGLSGKQLSLLTGWQPSKISRLETGRQLPSEPDVLRWGEVCGTDARARNELLTLHEAATGAHRAQRLQTQPGMRSIRADYNQLIARSLTIRHFETTWVPGLLQTPAYARVVLTEMVALRDRRMVDEDAAVAPRIERQKYLYDTSKRFEFLVAEPVLRWRFCPPDVMLAQLDRLRGVVGLGHIRFGILPLDVTITTPPQNAFQLYDTTAVVETFVGEMTHAPGESAAYVQVLDRLWQDAATGLNALALIESAVAALRPRCEQPRPRSGLSPMSRMGTREPKQPAGPPHPAHQ